MAILYSGKTHIGFRNAQALELGFVALTGRRLWIQKPPWGKNPSVLLIYDAASREDASLATCTYTVRNL